MIDKNRLLEHFIQLVKINAPSGKESAVGKRIIPELTELGLTVSVDDSAAVTGCDHGNIVARLSPSPGRDDWRALAAHMDTVPLPHSTRPVIRDGVVFSDGTTVLGADDRAGIAVLMEALRTIREKDLSHPGLEIVFTVSEETGLLGSKALDVRGLRSSMAFVLDSSTPPGSIITTAPFATSVTWTVIGVAAHAGVSPEKGINAIQAASRGIASMSIGRIDGETTANIGTIRGGHATNIVCDRVEVKAEARSLAEDKLKSQLGHMRATMRKAVTEYGATLEERIDEKYPGFHLDPGAKVVLEASKAIESAGLAPRATSTGGGSDANIFNHRGIPSVNLGLGYSKAHSSEESMEIARLEKMAEVALALMTLAPIRP